MGVPGIIMANYYTRPNGPLRTVISYDNGNSLSSFSFFLHLFNFLFYLICHFL